MKKDLFISVSFLALLYILSQNFFQEETESEEVFFKNMLDVLEENVIHKDDLDWAIIRKEVIEKSHAVASTVERHALIYRVLQLIKTNHSSVKVPGAEEFIFHSDIKCPTPSFDTSQDIPNGVGYLSIPGYQGNGYKSDTQFANSILQTIIRQDQAELDAWIIDLRSNVGGNMYPMLAGLGPFFTDGPLGFFINPNNGEKSSFSISRGDILVNNRLSIRLKNYKLINSEVPIYVLISQSTASSGEAVAIAMKSIDGSIFVGSKTCGLATGNKMYQLLNEYAIYLTASYMADINEDVYLNGILPDIELAPEQALGYVKKTVFGGNFKAIENHQ